MRLMGDLLCLLPRKKRQILIIRKSVLMGGGFALPALKKKEADWQHHTHAFTHAHIHTHTDTHTHTHTHTHTVKPEMSKHGRNAAHSSSKLGAG
jgi:hypothetical protein